MISNLFPPHHIGGYELGCEEVVHGLCSRGSDVAVLTSWYGLGCPATEAGVYRWLRANVGSYATGGASQALSLVRTEAVNRAAFRRAVAQHSPDIAYFWSLRYVSAAMVREAHRCGLPSASFIFDDWLATIEESDAWCRWTRSTPQRPLRRLTKSVLKDAVLRLWPDSVAATTSLHCQFASRFLKEQAIAAGKAAAESPVIHWGVDEARFPAGHTRTGGATRLLFVGQVVPHKGVHTAVAAVRELVTVHGWGRVELDIVGGSTNPGYLSDLTDLARSLGIGDRVHLRGPAPRGALPEIYSEHDVLLFPSIWEEPFGITLLEAMSCGTVVVATGTGGSAEILDDEINALIFAKEDAAACARQVDRIFRDEGFAAALRANALATVRQRFRLDRTMDRIEEHLQAVLAGARGGLRGGRHAAGDRHVG